MNGKFAFNATSSGTPTITPTARPTPGQPHRLSEHHAHDVGGARAECETDPELAGALGDEERSPVVPSSIWMARYVA